MLRLRANTFDMLPLRMTLTAAPGLPLVIGLPFLIMLVLAVGAVGVFWALGRLTRH